MIVCEGRTAKHIAASGSPFARVCCECIERSCQLAAPCGAGSSAATVSSPNVRPVREAGQHSIVRSSAARSVPRLLPPTAMELFASGAHPRAARHTLRPNRLVQPDPVRDPCPALPDRSRGQRPIRGLAGHSPCVPPAGLQVSKPRSRKTTQGHETPAAPASGPYSMGTLTCPVGISNHYFGNAGLICVF